ncbi:hypothetical protein Tco_1178583, partial [Tanacetum coccineum]
LTYLYICAVPWRGSTTRVVFAAIVGLYTSHDFQLRVGSTHQENLLQRFKLPEHVVCIGRYFQIELIGRVQKQEIDGKYYICVAHVQVIGRQLSPAFSIAFSEQSDTFLVLEAPLVVEPVLKFKQKLGVRLMCTQVVFFISSFLRRGSQVQYFNSVSAAWLSAIAYMRSSALRKAALRNLSKTLTVDALFYLKEQFSLLERSKNGSIKWKISKRPIKDGIKHENNDNIEKKVCASMSSESANMNELLQ